MTAMFDIWILNPDTGSYPHLAPEKVPTNQGKDKRDKYLQTFMEHRCHFNMLIYSSHKTLGVELKVAHHHMTLHINHDKKQKYANIFGL